MPDAVMAVALWLVRLLPELTVDLSGICGLNASIGWVGNFIDLPAFVTYFRLMLVVEGSVFAVRGLLWIYEHLPGVGAGG
jgi:hypothetical protein